MNDQRMLDLRLQRSLSEYRFLESQLGEMKYVMECFAESFNKDFESDILDARQRSLNQPMLDGASQPLICDTHDDDASADSIAEIDGGPSRLARRVYKRLALVLHPDKPTGSVIAFRDLEEAYRDRDTLKLMLIADYVGVNVMDMYIASDDLTSSLKVLQTRVSNIKSSIAWAWYDAIDSDRPALRQKIVDTLSRVSLR